jgi:hypothetical protein
MTAAGPQDFTGGQGSALRSETALDGHARFDGG